MFPTTDEDFEVTDYRTNVPHRGSPAETECIRFSSADHPCNSGFCTHAGRVTLRFRMRTMAHEL